MKRALGVTLLLVAFIFMATVARADFPLKFDKVHSICDSRGTEKDGVKIFLFAIPDKSPDNPGGTITCGVGESERGIGVHIAIVDSAGKALAGVAIFHMHEEGNVTVNMMTGAVSVVGDDTIVFFIEKWLEFYERYSGTRL